MSKITIRNLCLEMNRVSLSEYNLYGNIEVVPRKLVEMIIDKCEAMKLQTIDDDYEKSVVRFNTCSSLKEYAESLLNQFEEE